jgi:predicted membrane-bound dolichyl-phosphate-mannose-protein mannosyltransferase
VRALLTGDATLNLEHPPLAKYLMATSLALGGDTPLGWRWLTVVFGALTLVGIYWLALGLFKGRKGSETAALLAVVFTAFNQIFYVQSRTTMLDPYMMALIVAALAAFVWERPRLYGVLIGCALACKWFAIVPFAVVLGVWLTQKKRTNMLSVAVLPFAIYFLSYVPLFFFSKPLPFAPWQVFEFQFTMLKGQISHQAWHLYLSQWWDWLVPTRPVWYTAKFDSGWQAGQFVVFLGNPIIMIAGALAAIACAFRFNRLIALFYFSFYLFWAVMSRKTAFYYYYYPAALMLSLALAQVYLEVQGWRYARKITAAYVGTCVGVFLWFYPLLAGWHVDVSIYRKRMWLDSWNIKAETGGQLYQAISSTPGNEPMQWRPLSR